MWVGCPQSMGDQKRMKDRGGRIRSLCFQARTSISPALDWNLRSQLTWFSGLQTHTGTIRPLCWVSRRSWIFWVSRLYESIPYNKYNNICLVGSVSRENPASKIANLYWLIHRKHELLCSKHWTLITFFKLSHLHHTKTQWGRYYYPILQMRKVRFWEL